MIYEGKEYKEVTDGSAEIGDLLHVTVLDGNASDVWCFSTDNLAKAPDVDIKTPNGGSFLDDDLDVWTRYRYVKDVEENSSFSVGDTVKVIGGSTAGCDELIGKKAVVVALFDDGEIGIDEGDYIGLYPASALELIGRPIEPIAEELSQTVESNAITLAVAANNKLNGVAKGKIATEKSTVFAVVEYSFSHQGLVSKKEVDRHGTLDRAVAVSEGLNNRNRKCFYSVDEVLV